jgi:cation:H+ antiporter
MPRTAWAKIALCLAFMAPGVVFRLTGFAPNPVVDLFIFGGAVVAASFLLAWAAEAAQLDISGPLAIAILALIAVLPEYAVDLYYAFRLGYDPSYEQFAAANMLGSNRLLLGFGWPLVVFVAIIVAARAIRAGKNRTGDARIEGRSAFLQLDGGVRMEIGFLVLLAVVAFLIPLFGTISMWFGLILVLVFVAYLWRAGQAEQGDDEELVGMAANIGALPQRRRRITVIALFVIAAAVILASAEPFATALVDSGSRLGVDSFFLVQWLAPLSSEAPEFIVAILFALRGNGAAAIGTLIASKVNQWSLLVGSLPIAHALGGGGFDVILDARQTEEFVLTASQTLMGIAIIIGLRFHRWAAIALVALFAVQFAVTGTTGRYILSAAHLLIALVVFWIQRRNILPTLAAPFRRPVSEPDTTEHAPVVQR